jgi:deazaflavin-dependent oxidoreductase (nitroreductase family)
MSSAHALGTPRAPSIIPLLNPLIRRLLGAGLPFGPNVLLTIRGRTSGLPRTFPVAILERDGRQYVQSPFGEVNWVRNLRAAGEAIVSRGDHHEDVEAVELAPDVAGPVLRDALSPYMRNRLGAVLVGRFFQLRTDSTLERFVAEARRHPMFELRARGGSAHLIER